MRRSSEISALKTREPKAWKVIDQHLRLDVKGIPAKVRQAAAEFILKRLYPEKVLNEHSGPEGGAIPLQVYIPKNESFDPKK